MYRDPMQWKQIRERVLKHGVTRRKVALDTGIGRKTIAKMLTNEIPPPRKQRVYVRPKIGEHAGTIRELVRNRLRISANFSPSIVEIYRYLTDAENYSGSYGAVRDYVSSLNNDSHLPKISSDMWDNLCDVLFSAGHKEAALFLKAMSHGRQPTLSGAKLKSFMHETRLYAEKAARAPLAPSADDRARGWLHSIAAGAISETEIIRRIGQCEDLPELLTMAQNNNRIQRNRGLSILAWKSGISARATARVLQVNRKSFARYLNLYKEFGAIGVSRRKGPSNRKIDNELLRDAVFSLLHEPPSNYDINRTTWRMEDFKAFLAKKGYPACEDVIRKIIKKAGYRWRKARVVLTSQDPNYSEKLKAIQLILSNLRPDELFFSIDEYGPFAVKMKGGRSLVGPGEIRVVPQWQRSKGCLILTAALELSENQVTHFYSKKKNTDEMIKLMDILVRQHADRKRVFLSWDAASWHISKKLQEHIENHNQIYREGGMPLVQTAPLPSGAQFLNVIESVFSGMARAIIHNSDYGSVDDAKAAIDRYFAERNDKFKQKPCRAGKKIWGNEHEPAVFSPSANFKDPRYR